MNIESQLIYDEGIRSYIYPDSLGFLTIGVGRCVDKRITSTGLSKDECLYLLKNDIESHIKELTIAFPWFSSLNSPRQSALINLCHQLGISKLKQFSKAINFMAQGDYENASKEFLDSKWAAQTPDRAKRVCAQIKSGNWEY